MNESASRCDPRFRPLLTDYGAEELHGANATVYGLWPDLTLAYLNEGWFRFAAANDGQPAISRDWMLGRRVLDAVAAPIREFFGSNYRRCLQERCPWEHTYECSSDELYRMFHMQVFPLGNSEGLLLVNSVRIESAQMKDVWPPVTERYVNEHGLLTQCCHCRRFRRVDVQSTWDWVARWIKAVPANVSHGICATCLGFYYSQRDPGDEHPRTFSTSSD